MFNCEEYLIKEIKKRELSQSELNLADKYPIVTEGNLQTNEYRLRINSDLDIHVVNDTRTPLKKARLEGCNFLIRQYDYPADHVFKSICYANNGRKQEPQQAYFRVEKI